MSGIGVLVQTQGTATVTVTSGAGITVNSGLAVIVPSGLFVIADIEVLVSSGLNIILESGTKVFVQSGISVVLASGTVVAGIPATLSGLLVVLESGTKVFVQSGVSAVLESGLKVISVPGTDSTITGAVFAIGTSATQFPTVAGRRHVVRLFQSGIVYIAGVNTVTSGAGFAILGDPSGVGAGLELNVANLNLIYGAAVTSSQMTHVSFN